MQQQDDGDELVARDAGSKDFAEHPEGQFSAVCVDVVDMGMYEDKKWGKMKRKIRVVFQTSALNMENLNDAGQPKPFIISAWFTLSLSEKALLSKFLEDWFGKKLSPEQRAAGIKLEKLVGQHAFLQIAQAPSLRDGKMRANIQTVMRLPDGLPRVAPRDYVRVKDRPKDANTQPQGMRGQPQQAPRAAEQVTPASAVSFAAAAKAPPLPPTGFSSLPGVPEIPPLPPAREATSTQPLDDDDDDLPF